MKLTNLEKSLSEIKTEEEHLLDGVMEDEFKARGELRQKELELDNLKDNIKMLDYIKSIKDDSFLIARLFMPFLEIPAIFAVVIAVILLNPANGIVYLCNILSCILLFDITYNFRNNHKKLCKEENGFFGILKSLFKLIKSRDSIIEELDYLKNLKIDLELDIESINEELSHIISKKSELNEELDAIEGYLLGIKKLINRDFVKELSDTSEVVLFVEKCRKLNNHLTP